MARVTPRETVLDVSGSGAATSVRTRPAEAAGGPRPDGRDQERPAPWLRPLVRRHRWFAAIFGVAVLLRLVTMVGYRPAMYFNDTFDYLHVAMQPYPHPLRPVGYSFLLLGLRPFHSFAIVVALQHLMGLGMGVMIYALLRRRFRLPTWGAALAAAPVLLDAYQIQLEHLVLSDTLFTFLVLGAVTLLLWHDRPSWQVAAAIGVLIALAWLTRSVGMPVLLGVLAYMLLRRMSWKTFAVMLLACMIPVTGYMTWFASKHHKFAMTESSGVFLFARVYKFADCHKIKDLTVDETQLCVQPANVLPNSQDGIWNREGPLHRVVDQRFGSRQNEIAGGYAKKAIMAQPGDYLGVVSYDFFRVFKWDRTVFPDLATYRQYEFEKKATPLPEWRMSVDVTAAQEATAYERGSARTKVVEPVASVIRVYQDYVYVRGTMLGAVLLLGLAGMVAMWRRFGGAAFLPWSLAVGLLLAPAATAEFDYRYVLPAIPLASLAAAIAFSREPRAKLAGSARGLQRMIGRRAQ